MANKITGIFLFNFLNWHLENHKIKNFDFISIRFSRKTKIFLFKVNEKILYSKGARPRTCISYPRNNLVDIQFLFFINSRKIMVKMSIGIYVRFFQLSGSWKVQLVERSFFVLLTVSVLFLALYRSFLSPKRTIEYLHFQTFSSILPNFSFKKSRIFLTTPI